MILFEFILFETFVSTLGWWMLRAWIQELAGIARDFTCTNNCAWHD